MSRHRDIRNMDYTDDYDGYNDVYGHSVDDDYCISPSNRQFLYNRDNSRDSSLNTEKDIQEEDEIEASLSDLDKTRLESCIDQIEATLGSLMLPRSEVVNLILTNKFAIEPTIDAILLREPRSKEKDVNNTTKNFTIPKFNLTKKKFDIPKLERQLPKATESESDYASLSELVSNHLNLNKAPVRISFGKAKLTDTSSSSININSKSEGLITHARAEQFELDLSKALRTTSSAPVIRKRTKMAEEEFDLEFVDDRPLEGASTSTILLCQTDVSNILTRFVHNRKNRSVFGAVLCRNFQLKHRKRVEFSNEIKLGLGKIRRFAFGQQSPDDLIRQKLTRNRNVNFE